MEELFLYLLFIKWDEFSWNLESVYFLSITLLNVNILFLVFVDLLQYILFKNTSKFLTEVGEIKRQLMRDF